LIPDSSVGIFSYWQLFDRVYGLQFSVFQCPFPCSVMWFLGWKPLYIADHRSGKAPTVQVCGPFKLVWEMDFLHSVLVSWNWSNFCDILWISTISDIHYKVIY
jgi:hypothetical protein